MALRVKPTQEELASVYNEAKKSGFFRRKLFGRKADEQEAGRDIGQVMAVNHTGHAAFDASKGAFDTRGLPPQLQNLFDAVEQSLVCQSIAFYFV